MSMAVSNDNFSPVRTFAPLNNNGSKKARYAKMATLITRARARTLIGGGGCIFVYSGYARLISFQINFITKETSRAEPEYMNIHPPISVLAPALPITCR